MIDSLLSLPDLLGGLLAAALTTCAGVSVYFISYRLFYGDQSRDRKDPASGLFQGEIGISPPYF